MTKDVESPEARILRFRLGRIRLDLGRLAQIKFILTITYFLWCKFTLLQNFVAPKKVAQ